MVNNPSRRKRKVFNSKNFQSEFFKAVSKDFCAKAQSDEYNPIMLFFKTYFVIQNIGFY